MQVRAASETFVVGRKALYSILILVADQTRFGPHGRHRTPKVDLRVLVEQ